MTLIRRYKLGGLNLRDSDINRPPEQASDVQNVEFNDKRELVKRFGYDQVTTLDSLDIIEYYKENSMTALTTAGLKRFNGLTFDDVPFGNVAGSYAWTTEPDTDEYNGVQYITDPDLNKHMFKYDGDFFFRAGMPEAEKPDLVTSGVNFYRYHYSTIDARGNMINGNYYQFDSNSTGTNYDVLTYDSDEYKARFAVSDGVENNGLGIKDNTAGDVIASYSVGHNVVADTWMIIPVDRVLNQSPFAVDITHTLIYVKEVDGINVTLDFSTLEDGEQVNFSSGEAGDLSSMFINIFYSADETFGYYKTGERAIYQITPTQSVTFNNSSTGASSSQIEMEDVYDTTIIKGPIPKCKYVTLYNNVMVLANTAEKVERNTSQEESFFWSDTGVGSSVETFPPFNVDTVGISSEGPITGVKALSDNMIIGKERQIYYVNGNLVLHSYRIRSALTNGVGCVSHRSMQEIQNGSLFMSSRGIYHAMTGNKPVEYSDLIEPLFRSEPDLDLTKTKIVNDIKNEKLLIFIPALLDANSITLVYDYLYKEWFLHRGLDADGGIVFVGNDLYHSDGANLNVRSSTYNDNGSKITAFYKSGWNDFDYPSIVKKFKKFVLLSIGSLSWTANVKTQRDWNTADDTDESIAITSSIRVQDQSLNMAQVKAMRFEIGNSVKNQGMLVTGYEFEVEQTQLKPKGE